jgi:hypothetical protein
MSYRGASPYWQILTASKRSAITPRAALDAAGAGNVAGATSAGAPVLNPTQHSQAAVLRSKANRHVADIGRSACEGA